jgi:hypothetical protein
MVSLLDWLNVFCRVLSGFFFFFLWSLCLSGAFRILPCKIHVGALKVFLLLIFFSCLAKESNSLVGIFFELFLRILRWILLKYLVETRFLLKNPNFTITTFKLKHFLVIDPVSFINPSWISRIFQELNTIVLACYLATQFLLEASR